MTYVPGPGDVTGTFSFWQCGKHDPRVPIVAYSLMFYELAVRLGAECQIVTHQSAGPAPSVVGGQFRFDAVTEPRSSGRWSYLWSQWRYGRSLVGKIREFDPHIVVTSTHVPSTSWGGLARGRKLVLTAHNTFWAMGRPPTGIVGRLRRALLARRSGALSAAVCISAECCRQLEVLSAGRVRGLIACPQIAERHLLRGREELRTLLFLGRIEHSKGVFLLLEAFEKLADLFSDINLVIAGSGAADGELCRLIAQSRHAARIRFVGRVGSSDVHALIDQSDLLVCPTMTSFNEGLAVVVFEAAAHGVPSVVSSVVPAAELLGDAGLVYTADDGEDLRGQIFRLITEPSAYSHACRATAAVRDLIFDRTRSWGSVLGECLMGL